MFQRQYYEEAHRRDPIWSGSCALSSSLQWVTLPGAELDAPPVKSGLLSMLHYSVVYRVRYITDEGVDNSVCPSFAGSFLQISTKNGFTTKIQNYDSHFCPLLLTILSGFRRTGFSLYSSCYDTGSRSLRSCVSSPIDQLNMSTIPGWRPCLWKPNRSL